ncbi:MAG TPA: hypothetical protein VER11_28485 [Polyangiaceae bacterium]|nr:hypothetical protein [Polyangiaceae bacterium]
MRVPQLVTDFFEWRWAPCIGLTAGSLAFVAFAVLLIPTRIGGEPRVVSALSGYESAQPQRTIFSSSLARNATEHEERAEGERVARAVPAVAAAISTPSRPPQRGFSPVLERPEPIIPAAPEATRLETPPPAPASVAAPQPEAGPAREVTTQ